MPEPLEHQLHEAWRLARDRAASAGQPVARAPHIAIGDPAADWARYAETVRASQAETFGPEAVADRFRIPDDYATFMAINGGGWESGDQTWFLYPAERVASYSNWELNLSLTRRDPTREDGLWLIIGEAFDETDRYLYLCCDRSHPLFGAVVVGYEGSHPYADPVPSAKCRVAAPSFLEHLRRAVGFWPSDDLPAPEASPAPLPVPSHLRDWVVPVSFEDEVLTATVRCPCGSERVELHYPGKTYPSYPDRRLLPCVVLLRNRHFFVIKAVCAECQAEHILFDRSLHGRDRFLKPGGGGVGPPGAPLVPWACRACGGRVHTAELNVFLDYGEWYFSQKHHLRFGRDRWVDAFGWIGGAVRCCGCGHHEPGWLAYASADEPWRSGCVHCGRPLWPLGDRVWLKPFLLPVWELLCNIHALTFHRACWQAWPLRERFIRRVNATGSQTLGEDGRCTAAGGGGWIGTANPRPDTLAVGQLEGVFREGCGPPLAGKPWSARVSVDYLEEGRFHARFMVLKHGWVAWVVVDAADPADRAAVLQQVEAAVARSIESRRIAAFHSGHPNGRKRLFKATPGMAWTLTGAWPTFSLSSEGAE